jgi:hypothetical protein
MSGLDKLDYDAYADKKGIIKREKLREAQYNLLLREFIFNGLDEFLS